MADAKKLVSLKMTPKEKKEEYGATAPAGGIEATMPDFPWGLCIHMDRDELEKLGISKLPEVNTVMTLTAKVVVTRKTESSASPEYTGGDADETKSIDLQITDAALE